MSLTKNIKKKEKIIAINTNQEYPFKPGEGDLGPHREKSPRINEKLGKRSLTEKQKKVLDFIAEHISTIGFPPTVRQIAVYFGVSAKAAHDHLKAIAKKNYIRLFPGSARGMEILHPIEESNRAKNTRIVTNPIIGDIITIPLIGTIAAGTPMFAEENIERQLALPKSFLPQTGNMFALKVSGESMINAGILDGDIAVIKKVTDATIEVKNGEIVAALIDGDATLKTYYRKSRKIELRAENPKFASIILSGKENLNIVGKLAGVYRKY